MKISQPRDYKLTVEKDVQVPMRDGAILYADVFRPESASERFPAVTNISAYQKDKLWEYMRHDLDSEYWRMCSAQWEKITVPLYSAGNWTSFALHLRGNTEAFLDP